MKKLLRYLPFHFLLCLIFGIYIQFYFNVWTLSNWWIFGILTGIICVLFFLKSLRPFSVFCGFTFFILGMAITFQSDIRNDPLYYENYLRKNNTSVLQITEVLKPNKFSNRYKAEVIQVNSNETTGKVLLSIRKDSIANMLEADQRILTRTDFLEVKPPLNPHQFDYKSYLARQGIHRQVYLKSDEFFEIETETTFLGWISQLRSNIQQSLKKEGFSDDEFGVMNALLLGQRQEVSKELIDDYSNAGAIHILAISGLHVGIILLLLSYFFKPLELIKKGHLFKLLFIVLFLWFFALLAGISASVVRAVTMFTAVAIGQSVQRKNSVVYSLILSIFVLLLIKPMFLFDVGFQLSYLAVFGIVTIQPKLSSLWQPKRILIDKIWQLTTVSLAAQLSVLPLSLFYFHQFPGLFLLSNLVIVPFLGIILIGGIVMILLSVMSILPEFLIDVYGGIISLMNAFIRFVSKQEEFLFSRISFSFWMLIASYILIVFGFQYFERKSALRLKLFLVSILVFQSVLFYEKYDSQSKKEVLLFHKNQHSMIGIREGERLLTSHSLDSIAYQLDWNLASYSIGEKVKLVGGKTPNGYFEFHNQQFLIIDSLGIYQLKELKEPIVILQHSPKINLNRLIDSIKPKQIVADGSNYKSLIQRWKETCDERGMPFWFTGEKGAYLVVLK